MWRLAVGVLVVFAAGMATGMFVGARKAHDVLAFKHHHRMGEHMREHLTRRLQLTPEQVEKLNPIIDDTSKRLHEIRRESGKRVADTMQQAQDAMAPHLTPEQRKVAEQMKMHHKRVLHQRRGGPSPPDDAP
jgi:Spy/CpxP family protein refolding chaperone